MNPNPSDFLKQNYIVMKKLLGFLLIILFAFAFSCEDDVMSEIQKQQPPVEDIAEGNDGSSGGGDHGGGPPN